MCGDGIIYMWNVKSVINNLKRNILTKSVALLIVKRKQEQLLLENIKTQIKEKIVLKGGIKAQQELKQKNDIGANQRQNIFKLLESLTILKEILKLKSVGKMPMPIVGVDIMQDIWTGKRLKIWNRGAICAE